MRPIIVFVAVATALLLAGCQTSQVGVSSYSGTKLGALNSRAALEGTVAPKKQARASITQKAAKSASAFPANERSSMIVKPEAKTKAKVEKATKAKVAKTEKKSAKAAKKAKPAKVAKKAKAPRTVKKKVAKTTAAYAPAKRKSPSKARGGKGKYRDIIAREARKQGVPLALAMAVVEVESNYRANARGAAGEIGLMQIMPRTARGIGYKGPMKKLYNPETNIRYGMKYLGKAYKLGGGTACGAILKYNAGHGAKKMNPISRRYCNRVSRIMKRG